MTIEIDPSVSRYLVGNFAPISTEIEATDLAVTGRIPEALHGSFLRNGPNLAFPPVGRYHLFDGDGMIHAVELADGKASYRNRWVESRGLAYEREQGHAVFGGLSNWVLPEPEVLEAVGLLKNTANTNIVRHAGRYLALMEGAGPTEVTRDLATVGEYDFDGLLHGPMTAHPKWDPATGEMLFFGVSPFAPFLRYHVVDREGRLTRSIDIDLPGPVMMHDFVVTERNVVFFDLPAVFDVGAMMEGEAFIRWAPDHGARIGVLPRDGGNADVRWIEVDPFYVFHFLNGWDSEDGSTVTVDGCRSPSMPTSFGDDEVPDDARPSLHRWTIDLAAGTVREEQLDDRSADFPRINEHHAGQPNRYGYVAHADGMRNATSVQFTGVVKYDLTAGTSSRHHYGDQAEAGEAVFAPDPDGSAEDDGWLLNLVYDRDTETSALVIVDARDLEGEPVATVHMPQRVPFGFHGNWMPERGDRTTT